MGVSFNFQPPHLVLDSNSNLPDFSLYTVYKVDKVVSDRSEYRL